MLILITMACVLTLQHRTARRERYLVYELLPGGDVHSRLNKDLRREVLGGSFHTWNIE